MALFHITIEKVVVKSNDELLEAILCKLNELPCNDDEKLKQEIMNKLNKLIVDVKSTV